MFLLCVIYSKDKNAKIHDNQDREIRVKYRQRTKRNSAGREIFCTRPHRLWDSPSLL
jgi:hypothetical protein